MTVIGNPGEAVIMTRTVRAPDSADTGKGLRKPTVQRQQPREATPPGERSGYGGVGEVVREQPVSSATPEIFRQSMTPETRQDRANRINAIKKELKLVSVNASWAQQHLDSVVVVEGNFYRAAIRAGERKSGESTAEASKRLLMKRGITPEGAKGPGGGDINTSHIEMPRFPAPLPAGGAGEQATLSKKRGEVLKLGLYKTEQPELQYRAQAIAQQTQRAIFKQQAEFAKALRKSNPALYRIYKAGGLTAYNQAVMLTDKAYTARMLAQAKALKKLERYKLPPAETMIQRSLKTGLEKAALPQYDIIRYLKDNPKDTRTLEDAGFVKEDIVAAQSYIGQTGQFWYYNGQVISNKERNEILKKYAYNQRLARAGKLDPLLAGENPADVMTKVATPETRSIIQGSAPVLGTVNYAKEAGKDGWDAGEVAMMAASVAGDLLFFMPFVTGASAGARAAASGSKWITRATRIKGALKGVATVALGEISMPYQVLAHPVQTLKAFYTPIEGVFPRRIPISAVETTYHTIKLPKALVQGTVAETKALRTVATDAAIAGKEATATINGVTFELEPTALQKLGKPMAVSATPDIRPFIDGATISKDGLFVAPTAHTRFAQATSAGEIPADGIKGLLFIRDPQVLAARVASPRAGLYRGTAEIEELIKGGTKLGKPTQMLYTRDASGNLLRILVYGEKFTPVEIAKLKLIGLKDTLRVIYTPPARLSKEAQALVDLEQQVIKAQSKVDDLKAANKLDDLVDARRELDAARQQYAAAIRAPFYAAPVHPVYASYADYSPIDRYRQVIGTRRSMAPYQEIARAREKLRTVTGPENRYASIIVRREALSSGRTAPRVEVTAQRRSPAEIRAAMATPRIPAPTRASKPPRVGTPLRTPAPPDRTPAPPRMPTPEPRTPVPPETPIPPWFPKRGKGSTEKDYTKRSFEGAVTFKQGFGWWVIWEPGTNNARGEFVMGKTPPPGAKQIQPGKDSSYRSIQTFKGPVDAKINVDLGIMDIKINKPSASPGKSGAIKYKTDRRRRTSGDLVLGSKRGYKIRREGPYYRVPGGLSRQRPHGRLIS